jgi:hypothetical protein
MTDHYRNRLKHAGWTWRERKRYQHIFGKVRRKDRESGRADKRAARAVERRSTSRVAPANCCPGTLRR